MGSCSWRIGKKNPVLKRQEKKHCLCAEFSLSLLRTLERSVHPLGTQGIARTTRFC